jgi:hypothetical protein
MEEFFEEQAREAARVVADDAVLFEEIIENDAKAQFLKFGKINDHGLCALRTVAASNVG